MLSREVETSLELALSEAKARRYQYLTLEHLLLVLLDNPSASAALKACGANLERLRHDLNSYVSSNATFISSSSLIETEPKPELQRVLQRALFQVQSAGKLEVNGANLLVAIFGEPHSRAVYFLRGAHVTRLDILNYLSHGISKPSYSDPAGQYGQVTDDESNSETSAHGNTPLENYATNLNVKALSGKLDPMIGRTDELERMLQILCRRRKNNPLLVGEAGVGKTAIAEGLASAIVAGNVPEVLMDSTVYSLDLGSLLAGTKYRGDFEKRLKELLAQIKQDAGAILFIDEIHTIIGAGAASGGVMDASNLLKPLLTNGELRCVGSTTYQEYRGIFEKDRALARRFQKIDVPEPDAEETVAILKGLKARLEQHHKVKYTLRPQYARSG